MVNLVLACPLPVRVVILFVFGLWLGGQLNRAIYRLAWNRRPIGPWSPPHADAPPRRWWDRIPVAGWFALDRESHLHGNWYWLRPLCLELATAAALVVLYLWELDGGLTPSVVPGPEVIHLRFLNHVILLALMIVATFIDLDEKTIPDMVTVPGSLIAFAWASVWPSSLLPAPSAIATAAGPALIPDFLRTTSPNRWPSWLDSRWGLALAIAAFGLWCYALLPKTVWLRSGYLKAAQYLIARILREPVSKAIAVLFAGGTLAVIGIWFWDGAHWQGLSSSLMGMLFGVALTWSVRVIAGRSLGREAMGFGDVTLMGMIGAFLGWQAALMVFFFAPFAGVLIAVAQWIVTREAEIAFGPFLCLAALFVLGQWPSLWEKWGTVFAVLGWLIPVLVAGALLLMAAMLRGWMWVKSRGQRVG